MTVQRTRDQLRALANAATPGPWEERGYKEMPGKYVVGPRKPGDLARGPVVLMEPLFCDERSAADAEFIVAARTALPQLIDQLDAAEQRIRDLTQEVKDERGAALDQMEQVAARDKRIGRLENRAASETARANEWRRKHRVMAGKRDAAHRAYVAERGSRRAAETRLQAVEDVLDDPIHLVGWGDPLVPAEAIRRALDS